MKCAGCFWALFLVFLFSVQSQAIGTEVNGFQGVFGDAEALPLEFVSGLTSGSTAGSGITASFDNLSVDLSSFTSNGDVVSISDLVLNGTGECQGAATYVWDEASLIQIIANPKLSIGAGVIVGTLVLQDNDLHFNSSGVLPVVEPILLPQKASATLTYNGVIVASDGTDGSVSILAFPSASITAVAIPEPSTIVCLLSGCGMFLLVWRRKS